MKCIIVRLFDLTLSKGDFGVVGESETPLSLGDTGDNKPKPPLSLVDTGDNNPRKPLSLGEGAAAATGETVSGSTGNGCTATRPSTIFTFRTGAVGGGGNDGLWANDPSGLTNSLWCSESESEEEE
ncbi:hypothetical protein CGCSCA4_v005327 [Colletotrichum siamense]|uniref:Uncharacterized protein n=1 Tax=Colletotrichum siamense TaxID=690259 RepID=A0A9P5EVS9_COLSI|nr:hypothetical protein CGCSCA4_v005327 [Colletotrichum siamense]KAF4861094.1 hypothetical protein CGCSCA2_v004789 [Colletotrichum siamense]